MLLATSPLAIATQVGLHPWPCPSPHMDSARPRQGPPHRYPASWVVQLRMPWGPEIVRQLPGSFLQPPPECFWAPLACSMHHLQPTDWLQPRLYQCPYYPIWALLRPPALANFSACSHVQFETAHGHQLVLIVSTPTVHLGTVGFKVPAQPKCWPASSSCLQHCGAPPPILAGAAWRLIIAVVYSCTLFPLASTSALVACGLAAKLDPSMSQLLDFSNP